MRVLIDTSPLLSGHAHRGVGSYTRNLANELEKIPGLELAKSTNKKDSDCNPDIIHYPFFDLFFDTLPIQKKTKTIVTIHDVIPLIFPDHYKPGKKGFLRFLKQKLSLKGVDLIITDSKNSKNDIVKYLKINPNKISVVYLAANPNLNPASQEEILRIKKRFLLPRNYILYVGDINYNKNLPQLIKSLKYLPPTIKLVCVGKNFIEQDIPEWKWIKTQMALSDVESRVKFVSNVSADDYESLSSIYSGATAYVQPSLYEGFGLPVLEAMKCGTPVVCSHNSSLIEVGGERVLFAEPNAESLARKIDEIITWSEDQRQDFVKKALKWSESFSWKKTAHQTFKLYQNLLHNEK
ncbi:MAG: glycosyltransferase family 4 protein [Patescibacteria group bacterium]